MKHFKKEPRFSQVEPKPFFYIDLSGKVDRTPFASLEVIEGLTGRLNLQVQVVSDYLFVGSGSYDFRERDKLVYYTFFRSNGKITIPGTTIKGAVRSVAEAISNSCVSQIGKREKRPTSHEKCEFKSERNKINLCPTCKIFGTTGYSGRVRFSDSLSEKSELEIIKIGELFSPRLVQARRKFYQNKKFQSIGDLKPEKNYRFIEAAKKDSIFNTTLDFQNLSEGELSLLLFSMGINQDFMIKIGGAKPRCLGTVKFKPKEIKLLNKDILNPEKKFESKDVDWVREIMKNQDLINTALFDKFKNELKIKLDACPRVNY
jgi:CRISPR/Cas system CSM-associated protein Csm3 (group 7 of RAMP superfamily)